MQVCKREKTGFLSDRVICIVCRPDEIGNGSQISYCTGTDWVYPTKW